MDTRVSTWRCKCGTRIKVLGAVDKDHLQARTVAECPTCGDKQVVYAARILFVTQETDEAAQPQTSE
jgi:hypothetical protein